MEDAQNLADLSSDFANTFMLDEELELEQKTLKNVECLQLEGTAWSYICLVLSIFGFISLVSR
jgi:hypothetical protein